MARWAWLLVVAACTGDDPARPVDAIDVVVSDDTVIVYPRGDLSCEIGGSRARVFPALGTCESVADANVIVCAESVELTSCLTEVSVDGVRARIAVPTDYTRPFAIGVATTPASTLRLRGCVTADVPLAPVDLATPTVTATHDDVRITASWTADRPFASSLVRTLVGFGGALCHTAETTTTRELVPMTMVSGIVRVQTLQPPETVVVDDTTITIWRGNAASADL